MRWKYVFSKDSDKVYLKKLKKNIIWGNLIFKKIDKISWRIIIIAILFALSSIFIQSKLIEIICGTLLVGVVAFWLIVRNLLVSWHNNNIHEYKQLTKKKK